MEITVYVYYRFTGIRSEVMTNRRVEFLDCFDRLLE